MLYYSKKITDVAVVHNSTYSIQVGWPGPAGILGPDCATPKNRVTGPYSALFRRLSSLGSRKGSGWEQGSSLGVDISYISLQSAVKFL